MAIAPVDKRIAVRGGGRVADLALAGLGATLVTLGGRWAGANAAMVGFLFLLLVLGLSVSRGLVAGSAGAIIATLCYNYFFLAPVGTFTIADPANWVALGAFLVTAVVVSKLVVEAQVRAQEAQSRARETQILNDLAFGLFTTTSRLGTVGDATATCLRTIGARAGGLVLFRDEPASRVLVSMIGPPAIDLEHPVLAAVAERREVTVTYAGGERTAYVPLQLGETVNGVLVASGTPEPVSVLESVGRLMALAVERERLIAETTELEALKASDALKTSLLRAVSHDLRTPLTAMRLETDRLSRHLGDRPEVAPILVALSQARERLTRRIDELLAMVRLEAGIVRPRPEPTPPSSLFAGAREGLTAILSGRRVVVRIDPDCPDLHVDPTLATEIVVNLLENAARASPADLPLELVAKQDPSDPVSVRIEILDRGPGVPPFVHRALLQLEARDPRMGAGDASAGGLGLVIAADLARASDGRLSLHPRPGGGTIARLVLPAALAPLTVLTSP